MYLWKCWRSTRVVLASYGTLLLLMLWGLMRQSSHVSLGDPAQGPAAAWVMSQVDVGMIGFTAWILGSFGIGRDVAEGGGAFLLSQPRPRRFFVWNDGLAGMVSLAALSAASLAVVWLAIDRGIRQIAGNESAQAAFLRSAHHELALILPALVLYAGLVFGVTYLCMLLVPRVLGGIMTAAGVFIAYQWGSYEIAHRWQIVLPSWMLQPFVFSQTREMVSMAPHLWLEFSLRLLVVLVLLLAAQVVLDRKEIEA